jgi:hypothetical protein
MKEHYDFSNGKRGAIAPLKGKSRITIMLDDAVLEAAREQGDNQGIGYQTLINSLLREALGINKKAITAQGKSLKSEPLLVINEFNRRDVEALEAQLHSMAKSLHSLLSNDAKTP